MATRVLGKYVQDPDEVLIYSISYSDWLEASETISTAAFSVSPTTSPVLEVTDDEIQAGDESLGFKVGGGVAGRTYTVTVTIETSLGQTKEDDFLVVVRE